MKRRTFICEQAMPVVQALTRDGVEGASKLVSAGAVYVNGKRVTDAQRVVPVGATVTVVLEEAGASVVAAQAAPKPLEVVFEDAHVLAVNKPAGIVAQPTEGRVGGSLLDLASAYLKRPAGLVHRLDRETSGLTIFGKTAEATSRLAAAFREGRATKRYVAVVSMELHGEGTIDLPLSKDPSRPGRWRASRHANGIDALTKYRVVRVAAQSSVELFPQTGRTHQLRAHLTALGAPIVGDKLYGGAAGPRCLLHAQRLEVDGEVFEAPIPEDMAAFFDEATQ